MYLIILVTVIAFVVIFIKWRHTFWLRKHLPYKTPNFPFGNIEAPWKERRTIGEETRNWYREAKTAHLKLYGNYIFVTPILNVIDIDYVKRVLIKDFQYFTDHGFHLNEKDDPLSAHLLALEGEKWRNLRAKLAPAFTSSKTKLMFPGVLNCTVPMLTFLQTTNVVNIKELFASYTIDTIGSCAFGIECNSFKQRDNPFYYNGRKVFITTRVEEIRNLFIFSFPEIANKLRVKVTNREVEHFFMNLTIETVKYREENNIKRNDFMQMLIDIKNSSEPNDPFTIKQLAAQAFIFFLGGFETSSTTGTFCLFELALNQKIQQTVREEIIKILKKYQDKVTYEAVLEMKYLSQIIDGN